MSKNQKDIAKISTAPEAQALLGAILELATDAIIVIGKNQRIRIFNKGAENIFQYKSKEAVGKPIEMLLPSKLRATHKAHVESFAGSPETSRLMHQRMPVVGVRKDGSEFPAEASIMKYEVMGEQIFTVLARDIGERQLSEEKLRRSQRMETVGHLTGGVAHDFNNLLTVLVGNLDLLEDHIAQDAEAEILRASAMKAAERGADLTQRLLAFSRKQVLNPKPVDINALLTGSVEIMRRTLGEDIDIEVKVSPGLWKAVVDAGQLENAMLNLTLNARDAMPRGGRLTIETRNIDLDKDYARAREEVTAGAYVMIAVSDDGVGMPPEVVERAFEPFFTTKEVGTGSGLGLSMVYGFAKQSGGHLAIYSEVGEGTTVKLFLPKAADGAKATAARRRDSTSPGGGETILVVEDDADVRAVIVAGLRSLGYTVHEAGYGQQALDVLDDAYRFDLLITDVVLPGDMHGRDVAREVARLMPGIKVLYMSGYAENSIIHQGRLDPGVRLLMKPYRQEALAQAVRDALDDTAG